MQLARYGLGLVISAVLTGSTVRASDDSDSTCIGEPFKIYMDTGKVFGPAISKFEYEGKIQSRKQKTFCEPDPAVMEYDVSLGHVKIVDADDDGDIDTVDLWVGNGLHIKYKREGLDVKHKDTFESYQKFYTKARLTSLMMLNLTQ